MPNRRIITEPIAVTIAESKSRKNKDKVVPISAAVEIFVKPSTGSLVVRRTGRGGDKTTSSRARALKTCRGKKAIDFYECAKEALGTVSKAMDKKYGKATKEATK
ncbi:MAG: hypothetical protein AB1349_11695 [Elusimicrobiota bacterium]